MKIAVISSHTPSLLWFRMDMMQRFLASGHTVLAFGNESATKWKPRFDQLGIDYGQIPVSRNGINPIDDLRTFVFLRQVIKKEHPDKLFLYQAKPIIYGSLAGYMCGIFDIYSLVAGCGSIFQGSGFKNHIIRMIMSVEYKLAFLCNKKVIFQNKDDMEVFLKHRIVPYNKVSVVNGSGVNIYQFSVQEPPNVPTFLFIGRLIRDKGILEYLQACEQVKKEFPSVRCLLVGPYDTNPSSIKEKDLRPYVDRGIIEYFGEQEDVRPFIYQCSVFVLPSYREGTPKTVLEAMACGRPIITTDVPGCRDTVNDGINGYLVPAKDVQALAKRMAVFINNAELAKKMGEESRKIVELKYDVDKVNSDIVKIMQL